MNARDEILLLRAAIKAAYDSLPATAGCQEAAAILERILERDSLAAVPEERA